MALYLGLFVLLFAGSLLGGYVYTHEPLPATLTVRVEPPPVSDERLIGGSVVSLEGSTITIASETGSQTLPLAAGFSVDDLQAAPTRISEGAHVNVGLGRNAYGFFVSGIVQIEDAR
jgi:hypothetical protein